MRFPGHRPPSPRDLQEQIAAQRAGDPFLVYRNDHGRQEIVGLPHSLHRVTIGRGPGSDLRLAWDEEVSRAHAKLERVCREWVVCDDGLSRNGTFVNGERLRGRRRVIDGDELRFGATRIVYRAGAGDACDETRVPVESTPIAVTDMQRRVLAALCRPLSEGGDALLPATNEEIAGEVMLGVDAVKAHLRVLYRKFAIGHLPQNAKRARLAHLAIQRGAIGVHDFQG
jgi:hypothetical protein